MSGRKIVGHSLGMKTKRELLWTGWAFRATCSCGWDSGPSWMSRKHARKDYYRHVIGSATEAASGIAPDCAVLRPPAPEGDAGE